MSDAETSWANQQEWAEERARGFDIEINQRREGHAAESQCEWKRCTNQGHVEIEVKQVAGHSGTWIVLCREHDDDDLAFSIYEERVRE